MNTLGDRLRSLREDRKLLQKEAASMLNIKPQTYSRYENNTRTPDVLTLISIADFYNVSVDFLLGMNKPSINKNIVMKFINQIKKDILDLEQYLKSCK